MSLAKETTFDQLLSYYKQNRNTSWHNWLKVEKIFPRPGKQGLVGLMVNRLDRDSGKRLFFVFKISQYINYLVHHELVVMQSLNQISSYCPHFCKVVGGIVCQVDSTVRKEGNPFVINSPHVIEKEVLLMEYLPDSYKFYNYIRTEKISENVLFSTIKQTLMAIAFAQKKKKFVHYDLHSNNIMMKKCNKDLVFLYVLDQNNQFCVSSHGYYPVIIDFGFSYIGDMDDGYLWPSLGHTEVGFMSSNFDPIADPKLFLITVSDEIKNKRGGVKSKILRNIVRNIFHPLPVDWQSGWDIDCNSSASDAILDIFDRCNQGSAFFRDYSHYCIDILQSLVILPLQEQNYDNIELEIKTFVTEFLKIENEISSPFYCLYILKNIVDIARQIGSDYLQKKSRTQAINFFRLSLYEKIDQVVKFCRPKNIHFEKMLCSLLRLTRSIEGILYHRVSERMQKKRKMYSSLKLQSVEEMYAVIDLNIEDDYVFTDRTVVAVLDCDREKCVLLDLDEQSINRLNNLASISRGPELYQIYKK